MYQVTEDELDNLAARGTSLHWVFFGACFGGLVSFFAVLLSTNLGGMVFPTFVMLDVLFLILSAFFGVNGYRDWRDAKEKIKEIKKQ